MKIKILKPSDWYKHFVGSEFEVDYYEEISPTNLRFRVEDNGWIFNDDCVITELPESFCVKRCDDGIKWGKYIDWLNKTYIKKYDGDICLYYGSFESSGWYVEVPFGTEIHIDDMIKHIDYMERHIKGGEQFHKESQLTVKMDKEFDLTTDEGRLAYARKYYPIGTKYIHLHKNGEPGTYSTIGESEPRWYHPFKHTEIHCGYGFIYANGKWAEIIKEETNMETQKLSRQGLKEIHSIACSTWKITLEGWGSRNPLEDYIELSQKEIDMMFNASDNNQKSILSKYLKQDDWSVDLSDLNISLNKIIDVRKSGEYENKSFWLSESYNWEIKKDSIGKLCLIPTKKK